MSGRRAVRRAYGAADAIYAMNDLPAPVQGTLGSLQGRPPLPPGPSSTPGLSEAIQAGFEPPRLQAAYEDAASLLRSLRGLGMQTAVVTDADAWPLDILAGVGPRDLPDAVVQAAEVSRGVGAPRPFLEAAHRLGVDPGLCVLVGDDLDLDVRGARASGWQPAWLRRGPEKAASVTTLRWLRELLRWVDLSRMNGGS